MILTLEKETRQSLGAPRVPRTSHNLWSLVELDEDCQLTGKKNTR